MSMSVGFLTSSSDCIDAHGACRSSSRVWDIGRGGGQPHQQSYAHVLYLQKARYPRCVLRAGTQEFETAVSSESFGLTPQACTPIGRRRSRGAVTAAGRRERSRGAEELSTGRLDAGMFLGFLSYSPSCAAVCCAPVFETVSDPSRSCCHCPCPLATRAAIARNPESLPRV